MVDAVPELVASASMTSLVLSHNIMTEAGKENKGKSYILAHT